MTQVLSSTYRLQLHAGFGFSEAASVAGYLKELGISQVYCSPYLQAAEGSLHGYDVVDHQRVNVELGGEEGHTRFCEALKALGLGQVLDIVPNHMATRPENKYWWDVLENGPSSRFAEWFDIDWNSAEVKLQNKVLIPVLGDQYGHVLSANEIAVHYDQESFEVRYADHRLPLAPRSLSIPLSMAARFANAPTLGFIADSLSRLPAPESTDEELLTALHRDKTILYDLLQRFCREEPTGAAAIAKAVTELNRDVDALDGLLNMQNYRLAYWRTADQELGYRRFFDVNSLIGIRIDRPRVFNAIHARIMEWLRNGILDGVRVDHPDGLRDPGQYFERLRSLSPQTWILAEKILEPGESLRSNWPIAGTTGYDFLNVCNALLVYGEGLDELSEIYGNFTGEFQDFATLARAKKLNVEHEALGSDVNRLAQLFVEICENNRDHRDTTRAEIRRAIREVAASFSVYRTYVAPGRNEIREEDQREVRKAVESAKVHRTDIAPDLFDFLGDVLTLRTRGEVETEFLLRFQQFTSPVMAKGVEDTAFYCFNRMIGLNEVGAAPERNGIGLDEFHGWCAKMQAEHPISMNALSTHDTKRSDDVRARLAVLTEMTGRWRIALHRWSRMNQQFKTGSFPDRNTEYFLYQTLVGTWPIEVGRVTAYMEKAAREAKLQTSWTQQNKEFEEALKLFIERILNSQEFISELEGFVAQILLPGRVNSLAQTLIKCTAPGIPDTYQGSELWDLRLVDPDNRGPVDYEVRQALLQELQAGMSVDEIMEKMDSGMPKLWVLYKTMHLRRAHSEWFGGKATYSPLLVEGSKQENLIAFCRGESVAVLAPRWNIRLGAGFGSTTVELLAGQWTNVLTGEEMSGGKVRAQNVFRRFPVALLVREAGVGHASI
ncbi:MAG TPA: malto-oligosyltrehalose synthase [Terracidiphilus sp.]|jgi:(1->4)-alpha-D-glucan 1-alpha-D-glucosylmutase|nr:malto-oligosyltrehalose synthase [Terracidiphilus sp.]